MYRRYNAYGHRVVQMVADSEPALLPVVPMLAMLGILLTFCPPGQHAQRVERSIGYLDCRTAAVLAGLPFYLPPTYDLYADAWAADCANANPNSRSRPSTADLLVTGHRRPGQYK